MGDCAKHEIIKIQFPIFTSITQSGTSEYAASRGKDGGIFEVNHTGKRIQLRKEVLRKLHTPAGG
jgi:hypothetical protein